jgi:hypothetical protein
VRKVLPRLVFFLMALSRIGAPAAVPASAADLLRDFRNPPDNARIMVALVVVRSLSREGGTGTRDARDEEGRMGGSSLVVRRGAAEEVSGGADSPLRGSTPGKAAGLVSCPRAGSDRMRAGTAPSFEIGANSSR